MKMIYCCIMERISRVDTFRNTHFGEEEMKNFDNDSRRNCETITTFIFWKNLLHYTHHCTLIRNLHISRLVKVATNILYVRLEGRKHSMHFKNLRDFFDSQGG